MAQQNEIAALTAEWADSPRWKGTSRSYSTADAVRLRGSVMYPDQLLAYNCSSSFKKLQKKEFAGSTEEEQFVA